MFQVAHDYSLINQIHNRSIPLPQRGNLFVAQKFPTQFSRRCQTIVMVNDGMFLVMSASRLSDDELIGR